MINGKAQELLWLLEGAVRACGEPRATTALQLSGGLDSAIIQAIGGFSHLYCCTWPELDNMTAATLAARGRPVKPITFGRDEMIDVVIPEVARITEGKGTWSQCCQWVMAHQMARDGMTGELNGEGADELFGGYARYRILYWLDRIFADPHLVEYHGIIHHMIGWREDLVARMAERNGRAPESLVRDAKMTDTIGDHDERRGLPALIEREDRIAAAHGLTHRHPFMDREVVAFAHRLTEEDKITETESKHILRDAARHLGVAREIVDEQTKRGLVVPPQWAPADSAKWSTGWFDALMRQAWERCRRVA